MKTTKMIAIMLLLSGYCTYAQQYTQPVYNVRRDSAVVFGDELPPNYCGNPFSLKMNIYKPVGDNNTQRPVVICVHGGAFTSDYDFNESNMNVMAREFARRGYVAVSIDYREGHHLYPYPTGYPQFKDLASSAAFQLLTGSSVWTSIARSYVTDAAEVTRSIYRAQQDVKAAIRKMKQRYLTDSTSTCRVFLAGHSAGGIAVLTAVLTDREVEKPATAGVTTTAPNPTWKNRCEYYNPFNPSTCAIPQNNGPQGKDNNAYGLHNPGTFNFDAASCYLRSDLGPVNGNVNAYPGINTSIMGVASLCGAVADTLLFNGDAYPPIFMYHQPADRVVSYSAGRPFSYLNDFFTPAPNANWPVFYGSGWIKNKLARMAYPAANVLWNYDNSANDPLGLRTHDLIPSVAVITDSIARFFSRVMDTSGMCSGTNVRTTSSGKTLLVIENTVNLLRYFPNPVTNELNIVLPGNMVQKQIQVTVTDITGKIMTMKTSRSNQLVQVDCTAFPQGIYFITVEAEGSIPVTERIVKAT